MISVVKGLKAKRKKRASNIELEFYSIFRGTEYFLDKSLVGITLTMKNNLRSLIPLMKMTLLTGFSFERLYLGNDDLKKFTVCHVLVFLYNCNHHI